jgi:hypothetical protein
MNSEPENIDILPAGNSPVPLNFPHFPSRHQAVIWRNWELVPPRKLADVLKTTEANIVRTAREMGLRIPPVVGNEWLTRGYITIIRSNWHLLPYEQLLQLLGWSAEKMAYTLREDDFLWHKLGSHKPDTKPVYYRALTKEEIKRTRDTYEVIKKYFPHAGRVKEKPFAFLKQFSGNTAQNLQSARFKNFNLRLAYSYAAVYGDPLLDPALDPYPDKLLACYRRYGINGIWLQGVLYTLIPWYAAPELSAGYAKRLANLRKLVERAAKYDIGVYLYLNEPRPMPLKFFDRYPDWKGVEYPTSGRANLCTSRKPILDYLENACERLFREVPGLTGVFTITMSENPTNCYSKRQAAKCPRCSRRPAEEVIAEVNRVIERGIHRAKPDARVIVWTWAWGPEWEHAALDLLPRNVELMCVSEWGLPTRVGGVKGSVVDYSISRVGPSARALKMWKHARKRGLKTIAKVQINNSWECSAVPYIPVPDLVEKHLQNLKRAGVNGLMLGWTLGGYPGGNFELFRKSPAQIALSFGKKAAPYVRQAHKLMSKSFLEFPFSCGVLYVAPQNSGPANLLFEKTTGYDASMLGFPYDDLKSWRSMYPEHVFEKQFQKLSVGWKKGVDLLEKALLQPGIRNRSGLKEFLEVATAAYCHFRSTFLQIAFIRLRGRPGNERIIEILDEERELARTLYKLIRENSRIGFEASNHYYYTVNSLMEKVLNCEYLRWLYLTKEG